MKKLIICIFLLYTATTGFCQTASILSRLEVGGNFGLAFGDNTSVVIAPQVGYAINNYLTVGGGINYSYFSNADADISRNYLGFDIFGRVRPIPYIILQAQPEIFRVWDKTGGISHSEMVPTFLLGAGVIIPMGSRGGMSVMANYDVVQNSYSPYRAGVFMSIGYTVSL